VSNVPQPIERALFREGEDGATVFFPWGLTRRGYRLPVDPAAKRRATRAVSLLLSATLAIGVFTAHRIQPLIGSETTSGAGALLDLLGPPFVALLLVLAGYASWVTRFVEDCPESTLVVSRDDRLREAAALAKPGQLVLIGLVLCAMSALASWLDPRTWWLGGLGMLLGIGLAAWALHLCRFAAPGNEPVSRGIEVGVYNARCPDGLNGGASGGGQGRGDEEELRGHGPGA
jgi:hypothetical protein